MDSSTSERRRAGELIVLCVELALLIAVSAWMIRKFEPPQTSALGPSVPTILDGRIAATGRGGVPANRPADPSTSDSFDPAEGSPQRSGGGRLWCSARSWFGRGRRPQHHSGVRGCGTSILLGDRRVVGPSRRGDRIRPRALDGGRSWLGQGGDHRRRGDCVHGCRPRSGGDVLLSGARHPGGRELGAALRRRIGDDAGGSPGGDGPPVTSRSQTTIDLAWNDVANESGYRIERSTDGDTEWAASGNTGQDVTVYSDVGLERHTTYFYRVIATNEGGSAPPSNVVSETTRNGAGPEM